MAGDTKDYEMGVDEQTFVQLVALEFSTVQIFRETLSDRYSPEELRKLCERALGRCKAFNEKLNSEDTPQSVAWKNRLDEDFTRIFGAIFSDDKTWDEL